MTNATSTWRAQWTWLQRRGTQAIPLMSIVKEITHCVSMTWNDRNDAIGFWRVKKWTNRTKYIVVEKFFELFWNCRKKLGYKFRLEGIKRPAIRTYFVSWQTGAPENLCWTCYDQQIITANLTADKVDTYALAILIPGMKLQPLVTNGTTNFGYV